MNTEYILFTGKEGTEAAPPPLPGKRIRRTREFPVLDAKAIESMIRKNCGSVEAAECHGKGKNRVYILPEAFQEYKVMVSYGRRSPVNCREQKYIGLGHIFSDGFGGTNIVVVHFIEIPTMNRSSGSASNLGPNGEANPGLDFLEYYRNEFIENERSYNRDAFGAVVDPFQEYGASEFVLEGHTHPDLGTFWSRTDRVSGAARAAKTPICIFVCDPVRQEMLGAVGKSFEPARVIVFDRISGEAMSVADDIVALTNECIRLNNFTGRVKSYTGMDGHVRVKINLMIPKNRRNSE